MKNGKKISRKKGHAQFIENIVMNIIFQNLLFLSIYSSIFIFIRWNEFSDVRGLYRICLRPDHCCRGHDWVSY